MRPHSTTVRVLVVSSETLCRTSLLKCFSADYVDVYSNTSKHETNVCICDSFIQE